MNPKLHNSFRLISARRDHTTPLRALRNETPPDTPHASLARNSISHASTAAAARSSSRCFWRCLFALSAACICSSFLANSAFCGFPLCFGSFPLCFGSFPLCFGSFPLCFGGLFCCPLLFFFRVLFLMLEGEFGKL